MSRDHDIPTRWLDALADPGAAPASSTAAGMATAMAAALLFMALERSKPAPFGSVAQARALRRRAEGRITQTMIAFERAREALSNTGAPDAALPIAATVPVLEGICEDAADLMALAKEIAPAVHRDSRADVAAAVELLAGATRATEALLAANRVVARAPAAHFTHRNLKTDLDDVGANFDGAPDLEFHLATDALELTESGLSHQRIPPGYRFPYGHTHARQEEVYVVVRGSGRFKLDDTIIDVSEWDAVRVPPGTWRGYEAGPDGMEILVIGAPSLGDDRRGDVEGRRGWWE